MLAIHDLLKNRFRVIRQTRLYGLGTIYEVHDESRFNVPLELKEILIDLSKTVDPIEQERILLNFERQAKIQSFLQHEAFPCVIDYFVESNHSYLITELVSGDDLSEQLQKRRKPFEFEEVFDWTNQLLDALDYLHTREDPVIHCTLNPIF